METKNESTTPVYAGVIFFRIIDKNSRKAYIFPINAATETYPMSFLSDIFKKSSVKKSPEKFTLHGVNVCVSSEEIQFVEELFDSLAAIPTGRKAIEDMKKYKTEFLLETSMGTAGGYFEPENNKIVMAKSMGMDFMQFALVHEARHLLQNNQGRNEAEEQNLDYASRLMINRATEADAQTQALQACLEWQAQGHTAPMKRFEQCYKAITDAYQKNHSLSDAFKGWYKDEENVASYEHSYDVVPYLSHLTDEADKQPFVSLKPADVAKFCGAERIENFEKFLDSRQARHVNLMTKTAVEFYDAVSTAKGAPHDPSLDQLPVRDLKGNTAAQIAAEKFLYRACNEFDPSTTKEPVKRNIFKALSAAVKAIDSINHASARGEINPKAEAVLQACKVRAGKAVTEKPVKAFLSAWLSSQRC